jgi:hypothetical protein
MVFLSNGAAFADSAVGYFNPGGNQGGQVQFTLNGDGSISASLNVFGSDTITIVGFGFNSAAWDLPESGFTPTPPTNTGGTGSPFGTFRSGFLCLSCGDQESWTIDGTYTSVFQVLNGDGGGASADFFLYASLHPDYPAQWAADAVRLPEPSSLALLGTGVLGLLGFGRRLRGRK